MTLILNHTILVYAIFWLFLLTFATLSLHLCWVSVFWIWTCIITDSINDIHTFVIMNIIYPQKSSYENNNQKSPESGIQLLGGSTGCQVDGMLVCWRPCDVGSAVKFLDLHYYDGLCMQHQPIRTLPHEQTVSLKLYQNGRLNQQS